MATLSFQIPDARMPELVDAWSLGWPAEVIDPADPSKMIPNPQTQQQYAKEQIRQVIVTRVQQHLSAQTAFPVT
jgi:hypothetical protein